MLDTLKGNALLAAAVIVLAVIGAVTYLASQSILSGADTLTIITLVLTGVVGVTSAHVAGQTAAAAFNTPTPTPTVPAPTPPAPTPTSPVPGMVPNPAPNAMPPQVV